MTNNLNLQAGKGTGKTRAAMNHAKMRKRLKRKEEETTPDPPQCCICKDAFSGGDLFFPDHPGHNAQPLADGRCCTDCNTDVIKRRLADMMAAKTCLLYTSDAADE